MYILNSLFSAFAMYSRLPVPRVEWKEENRRYALCFFPLIGVVIGVVEMLWYMLCGTIEINSFLFSAGAVFIPILITGGIHLDGFCDVSDAKACWGDRDKLFAVMSDSRIGAFAAINLAVYILLQAGIFSQIKSVDVMLICSIGFVQSRAWSGLAAVTFKNAKGEGTLASFSKPAQKHITVTAEVTFLLLTSAAMLLINLVSGGFAVLCGIFAFVYYRIFSYKKFGGITGDLAGWFLQKCEIMILAFAVFSELITEAIK